jgi:hypothetical protein
MIRTLFTALTLLTFIACGGETTTEAPAPDADIPVGEQPAVEPEAPAPPPPAAFEAPELEDGMQVCMGAVDCVVVELGCCNHCGGGALVAVNKTRAEEVKQKHGQKECDSIQCPSTECPTPEAVCSGGCKVKEAE